MTLTGQHPSTLTATASAVTLMLLIASCGTSEPAPDSGSATDAATETSQQEPEQSAAESMNIPATAVGDITEHVVDTLNAEQDSTADDWEGLLNESFREELDEQELAEVINQSLRPGSPWTATDYEGNETGSTTLIESAGEELELHIEIDRDERITLLLFTTVQEPAEPADSFDEVQQRMEDAGGDAHLLVLEDDEELVSAGSGDPAGIGSMFKLWVLLAVAESVSVGDTSWEETLELGEEHMSLSSGELQLEDPGHEVTVLEASQSMIEISDNTATDLLISHVGRDEVEEAVEDSGHHNPELMRPLMTTREVFQLRWGFEQLGQEYGEAQEERRYEILEELADEPLKITEADVTNDDGAERGLEWFATAEDVAGVHHQLASLTDDHPELEEILGANPGVPSESAWWETLAFKGGATPGVLAGSWHAVDDAGTARTVIFQVAGPPQAVYESEAEYWMLGANALELEAP